MLIPLTLPLASLLAIPPLEASTWAFQVEKLPALGVALVLSVAIGTERQLRGKNAGIRTHALVGIGAALFMLVSKYGFFDLLGQPGIGLDPSRIAAQIVSGIGFLGAGIIVFRSEAVRGLTTAASIWLTAAVGMACGGELFLLALVVTGCHFLVVLLGPLLGRIRPRRASELRIEYHDGRGLLRDIVRTITGHQWRVTELRAGAPAGSPGYVEVWIGADGPDDGAAMLDAVAGLDGVRSVRWQRDEELENG